MGVQLTDYLATILPSKVAKKLGDKLELHTVADLLYHFPRRYIHGRQKFDPHNVRDGDSVMVWGTVEKADLSRMRRRRGYILRVRVRSGETPINVAFFHPHGIARIMKEGTEVLLDGEITRRGRYFDMSHPNFMVLRDNAPAVAGGQFATLLQATKIIGSSTLAPPSVTSSEITAEDLKKDGLTGVDPAIVELLSRTIIPVYAATAGVSSWLLMVLVEAVLSQLDPLPEVLPAEIQEKYGYDDIDTALRNIHQPSTMEQVEKARERLRYDEAATLQAVLLQQQESYRSLDAPSCPPQSGKLADTIRNLLPYKLTAGQDEVLTDISRDISAGHPMNRLLQGEVGSGKTIVALLAMLQVVDNGHQAVLLAPTEVLATQHAHTIRELLGDYGRAGQLSMGENPPTDKDTNGDAATTDASATSVTLLTGSLPTAERRQALLDCVSGQAGIIIGTQALLQEGVDFYSLGMVVIDEQHRFGVQQRATLREKGTAGQTPHMMVMTATPIPRTVALTTFGDLQVSTLREIPAGRSPIQTSVVNSRVHPHWVPRIWERLSEEVAAGHQAYVVCPAIGDGGSGDSDITTVTKTYEELSQGPLHELRLGLLHGRLDTDEKAATMQAFNAGDIDVLVSTTVIEVGIDVPNATAMVIVDADRFGVSQLHQLRGRVGRGTAPGICLLLTGCDPDSTAAERLAAIESSTDGFYLAQVDLEQRREGDLLGTTQAGLAMPLRLLDIVRDAELVTTARKDMTSLLEQADHKKYDAWWRIVSEVSERNGVRYESSSLD
ncbi:MAG TPA: ATP-dependent DNA helicase RecG [Corynebacteriales bacterium]|nr:ATP-dependent DNA helicase RecG [Mycobacteriales bacterium]